MRPIVLASGAAAIVGAALLFAPADVLRTVGIAVAVLVVGSVKLFFLAAAVAAGLHWLRHRRPIRREDRERRRMEREALRRAAADALRS